MTVGCGVFWEVESVDGVDNIFKNITAIYCSSYYHMNHCRFGLI